MTHAQDKPNHLINEKSPYLLQHAYNPIDWYPWGEEAFAKAKAENKPIFLSIGYSTCHWCHVMEEESYSDPEVAAILNDAFVAIKVDREERPDIDSIYMNVAILMNGRGGWPLNIIMTPEQKPFFAATYIPKEDRFGNLGIMSLATQVKGLWQNEPDRILEFSDNLLNTLQKQQQGSAAQSIGASVLDSAYNSLSQRFDPVYGGFADNVKFPSPHNLLFLLRYYKRSGNTQALNMVEITLQAMRNGGIYDQLGYGFHRYSTDQ
ncbi:MAG TPA: thioredoxin domain-containing protein, partial [Trueperaceae bacterium]|nr:thioredoxin domain-containing protein [Trueperaceae bacterium]